MTIIQYSCMLHVFMYISSSREKKSYFDGKKSWYFANVTFILDVKLKKKTRHIFSLFSGFVGSAVAWMNHTLFWRETCWIMSDLAFLFVRKVHKIIREINTWFFFLFRYFQLSHALNLITRYFDRKKIVEFCLTFLLDEKLPQHDTKLGTNLTDYFRKWQNLICFFAKSPSCWRRILNNWDDFHTGP